MRPVVLITILLIIINTASAQLYIGPGTQFCMTSNAHITLQKMNMVNNGSFIPGSGTVTFAGDSIAHISGANPLTFHNLELRKAVNSNLLIHIPVDVRNAVRFAGGNLDLNGYDLNLDTTGWLLEEQEMSRITGANGGHILYNTTLNNPVNFDPASLGLLITSSANPGKVQIRRGHKPQTNATGTGNSAQRYFDIIPENNTPFNATLRMNYFDGELNGLPEIDLVLWKSTDNLHWSNQGFNARNSSLNYVERNNIPSFGRWTLSNNSNPLPVKISLFNLKCEGNKVVLNWKTSQEQNSSHFSIERSMDSHNWTAIGNIPAAGTSNTEKNYLFTDNNPLQTNYYRIVQFDLDGKFSYTNMVRSSCNSNDDMKVWPNPFINKISISITAERSSIATIKVFDSKGALVKKQDAAILGGVNQIMMELVSLPAGSYLLSAEWNNGQERKTVQLIKQ
jgi:hypothetical protein